MATQPEVDEYGNPVKKTALALQDPNSQQPIALSPAAVNGAAAPATPESINQGNLDLISKAQTSASQLTGQPTQLQTDTTKQAENYVNNPMGGYDPAKAKQAALDKGSMDWGNAFEAQREQTGNTSGSGLTQQNMLNNVLEHNLNQETTAADMDKQNYDIYSDAMAKSLASANSTSNENANIQSQYLNNLGTVSATSDKAAEDALAKQGFDYGMLQDAVKNGTATQADVDAFLAKAGVNVSPNAQNTNATQANQNLQYQFGLTHPQYVNPDGTLNTAGTTAFNNYINTAQGTASSTQATVQDIITNPANYVGMADPKNANYATYQQLKSTAPQFTVAGNVNSNGSGEWTFKNAPAQGTAFMYNGTLYVAASPVTHARYSSNAQADQFDAIDPNTGTKITIKSLMMSAANAARELATNVAAQA